ncbi:MAG TPA: outer membrane beta-barrel protein [Bacteroidales bacterium]|nr:outer membrane beta-barrel protein [Bacteroidales bacterium]
MKTKEITFIAILLLLVLNVFGQEKAHRFAFELNGGLSMSTTKPAGTDLAPGLGFEGLFHYRIMPELGIYAGWGWNHFLAEKSFAGPDICLEETGYIFGLQYKQLLPGSSVSYYVRGAGLYNHLETENSDGDIISNSGHGLGWQAAGGLDIPLSEKWSFTPGVKFNALKRNTDYEGITHELKHQYGSVRIGFLRKL